MPIIPCAAATAARGRTHNDCVLRGAFALSPWILRIALVFSLLILQACIDQAGRQLWSDSAKPTNHAIPQFFRVGPLPAFGSLTAMRDGEALIAVGSKGAIVRSTDGGANWSAVVNSGT